MVIGELSSRMANSAMAGVSSRPRFTRETHSGVYPWRVRNSSDFRLGSARLDFASFANKRLISPSKKPLEENGRKCYHRPRKFTQVIGCFLEQEDREGSGFWVQRFRVRGSGFKVQGWKPQKIKVKNLKEVEGSEVQRFKGQLDLCNKIIKSNR